MAEVHEVDVDKLHRKVAKLLAKDIPDARDRELQQDLIQSFLAGFGILFLECARNSIMPTQAWGPFLQAAGVFSQPLAVAEGGNALHHFARGEHAMLTLLKEAGVEVPEAH